jgi:thioredoxin 1
MVTTLTSQTLPSFIQQKGVVLVDFYAQWCGPCKMIGPFLDQLTTEIPGSKIGKIDVDENGELAGQYNISSIPCVLVFKDGELSQTLVGAQSKEVYKKALTT